MSFLHLARSALSMRPQVVIAKAARFAGRMLTNRLLGRMMRRQCSYPDPAQLTGGLTFRLSPLDPALLAPHAALYGELARRTLQHRFDVLGSGWVTLDRGVERAGFGRWKYKPEAKLPKDWRSAVAVQAWPGNQVQAAALLSLIEDPSYRPVDWHVDVKSGYGWPTRVWGASTAYAHKPGVDVKMPWELARMHHLVWLALANAVKPAPALAAEFRHQVLDFLAANPPGWGVNWACAMDVAIRAANVLLAWDLFRAHGTSFDTVFEAELGAALLAHGRHIAHHLEWSPQHRGNHYLANIAGLAFIAAYLPRSPETDLWLAFATQQLDTEIQRQFGPDGANFEASTAYHRLSAEMALFAVALILGLPADRRAALSEYDAALWRFKPALAPAPMAWPPFDATLERLARAARFAQDVTMPSGEIVQIGDNDSGRFFKLLPAMDQSFSERVLDVSHVAAAAQGLFDLGVAPSVDTAIIAQLAGGVRRAMPSAPLDAMDGACPDDIASRVLRVVIAPTDPAALDGLHALAYPDFGLFIWKNARAFVAVRCGPIGGNGLGAHAHNDQLAVEVEIDGIAFARDPGTFVYTPDLAARNAYRSALAHFVPRLGQEEPARLDLGPFRLEDRAQARPLRFMDGEFLGTHQGFAQPVWRRVLVGGGVVVIEDCTGGPMIGSATVVEEHVLTTPQELAALWGLTLPFSPGYGRTV
ncbi:MAG: alginate lyase family protein [Rhodospirillaceae bacterium]|nr:alginate lyase family protein [Rhodospirillales bacterium]